MSALKILKIGGVLVAGAGFFVGGLFLGDRPSSEAVAYQLPQQYYQADEIPPYPGSMEYPLGRDLAVNDVETRISYFYTKDSPEAVRDFYVKALKKNGLDPVLRELENGEFNVYALSKDMEDQINIAIAPSGGQTIVFPSVIPVSGKLLGGGSAHKAPDVPFSAHAMGIMNVGSPREAGSVVSYVEPRFDMVSAVGHIRDTLGRQNWQMEEYKPDVDGLGKAAFLQLKKGTKHMMFSLAKNQEGREGVAVIVNIQDSRE